MAADGVTSAIAERACGPVLMVGGPAAQRRFCEAIFKQFGVDVEATPRAQTAIAAMAQRDYQLVIVDEGTEDLSLVCLKPAAARLCLVGDSAQTVRLADVLGARLMRRPLRLVELMAAMAWAAS
jgi:DNA-binding response OmpR family regulator